MYSNVQYLKYKETLIVTVQNMASFLLIWSLLIFVRIYFF